MTPHPQPRAGQVRRNPASGREYLLVAPQRGKPGEPRFMWGLTDCGTESTETRPSSEVRTWPLTESGSYDVLRRAFRTNTYLTLEELDRLDGLAKRLGRSRSGMIRESVLALLQAAGPGEAPGEPSSASEPQGDPEGPPAPEAAL